MICVYIYIYIYIHTQAYDLPLDKLATLGGLIPTPQKGTSKAFEQIISIIRICGVLFKQDKQLLMIIIRRTANEKSKAFEQGAKFPLVRAKWSKARGSYFKIYEYLYVY